MAGPADSDDKDRSLIHERIDAARSELEPNEPETGPVAGAHLAWRMVVDLVVGTGLGAAMGYGLDVLLGTLPIFLAVLTLLGFAAGVNLMIRTSREIQLEQGGPKEASDEQGAEPPRGD